MRCLTKFAVAAVATAATAVVWASGAQPVAAAGTNYVPLVFDYNTNLQGLYGNYPSGNVTLGGVLFSIPTTGNNFWHSNTAANGGSGTVSLVIPVGISGVTGFDGLLNTYWGEQVSGTYASLTFLYSDGTSFVQNLDGNSNLRDYVEPSGYANQINGTTTTNVFSENGRVLDMTFVDLSSYSSKTLSSITLTDSGNVGFQRTFLSGATLATNAVSTAAPEPGSIALAVCGGLPMIGMLARHRRRVSSLSQN